MLVADFADHAARPRPRGGLFSSGSASGAQEQATGSGCGLPSMALDGALADRLSPVDLCSALAGEQRPGLDPVVVSLVEGESRQALDREPLATAARARPLPAGVVEVGQRGHQLLGVGP